MPGLITKFKVGMSAYLGQFRRVYQDPSQVEGGSVLGLQPYYTLLWQYYSNEAFENIGRWGQYKGHYRLYRQMRLLYNPTRRLCDFYATHIYPGALTVDPATVPAGTPIAMPLAAATPPEVRAGLAQLWSWSRWAANKALYCRYGAIAGSVLLEVVDDVDAGRVLIDVIWPSLITYIDLDPTGAVLAYVLQYPARDDDGNYYLYRKEVDRATIRFYKNDDLYDYGEGASYANPYGFVPAVWVKHRDVGGNAGVPAIHGSIGKIDELNSLGSHIHDQIHKVIGAPLVMWSDSAPGALFRAQGQSKRAPTSPYDTTDLDREGLLMLQGPAGGKVDSLAGQLQLHEAAEYVALLLTEIEADHPEMTMYRQLRGMSQVTGPAAARLMGDVAANVDEVATNYDAGAGAIFAMALAIGGWRANRGDWGTLRPHQQPFIPFGLDQYQAHALDIQIQPRPLIPLSEAEVLQLQQLRDSIKAGVQTTLAATLREALPE